MSNANEYNSGSRGFASWCQILAFLMYLGGILFFIGAITGFWGRQVGAELGISVLLSSILSGTFFGGLSHLISLSVEQAWNSYVTATYIERLYKSGKAGEDRLLDEIMQSHKKSLNK